MGNNISTISKTYSTRTQCIAYLEKLRWNGKVISPFTGTDNVTKRKGTIYYHCNDTNKDFSVLHGTIFEGSKYPLPKWFLMIGLILNAKKGIAAKELQRNVGSTYKTAWYVAMRIRCAMIDDCIELNNIVEMDEAYVGGKKRKAPSNHPSISSVNTKRGRGTSKTPIVGIVERNGNVVLKVIEKLTTNNLMSFLKANVNTNTSIVMTDKLPAYKKFEEVVQHLTIDHGKGYAKGIVHVNTIEGFWSIVKNSIKGNYVAISRKYLPFYLVQAQYIYNRRDAKHDLFKEFMLRAVSEQKCLTYYQPKKAVTKIVYRAKKKVKC
ncbi:IS1595 family transposase [Imperialibacter roseus]|uniref:IS1595 family transposase n=1 Tax=Imperialibacter roseus TaxID=1324217 RepID=A0ABZ0ISN4_9BACT|nr:IS1595 family transposase [Imperialibacter roseus]WOK06607.1 IS1595 family transposase [Imperialibacter roseus]